MKKFMIALAATLISVSAFAQTAKKIYEKYSDEKGVSAVYISSSMFRLIGKLPELEIGDDDVDIAPIIKSLSGMYILNSENREVVEKLSKDVKHYISSGDFEMLMEAKEDGEVMRMYTIGDEKVVRSFVLFATETDEVSFICFDGEIPRDKLESAIADAAKNN